MFLLDDSCNRVARSNHLRFVTAALAMLGCQTVGSDPDTDTDSAEPATVSAALRASPFNLLGPYNDDPTRATAEPTRHVEPQHRNWGEFRVPSLRNVAETAPYMHNGSLATLEAVVRHYSEVDVERREIEIDLEFLGAGPAR